MHLASLNSEALEGFLGRRDIGQILKGIWDAFVKAQSILRIWGYKAF